MPGLSGERGRDGSAGYPGQKGILDIVCTPGSICKKNENIFNETISQVTLDTVNQVCQAFRDQKETVASQDCQECKE
jgi:hypothetical protein